MEDKNVHTSVSGGAPSSSRWNPTKEQISILEGLYRQGIRTPSAEQIQQITSRLRAYGHIEGKNVFYWFQNHKARQRQKQKQQESMGYVNRFFHNTAPPVLVPCHPPCNNVFCSPFYTPNSGVGFYPHYPEVLLPGGVRSRPSTDKQAEKMKGSGVGAAYVPLQPQYYSMQYAGDVNCETINTTSGHQALHLFPLQPTEILEGRSATASAEESNPSSSSQITGFEDGSEERPFFNFFAEHGSCGSE